MGKVQLFSLFVESCKNLLEFVDRLYALLPLAFGKKVMRLQSVVKVVKALLEGL